MNEASEKPKFAVYFWLTVVACSSMSFGAGINFTWISPVLPKLTSNSTDPLINPIGSPITISEASWMGAMFPIGGMLGALAGGFTNELFGRKWTLMTTVALNFLISYLILAFSKIVPLFYLGRFIGGFAQGSFLVASPIYLGEIAETKTRGAIMSTTNMLLACGSLYGFCIGPYVTILWYSLLTAFWAALFMFLFFFCSESPHYLVYKNRNEEAERALMLLRGKTQSEANESLKLIEKTIENDKANKVSVWSICKTKGLRRAFVMCLVLKTVVQCTGFTAILTYLNLILKLSGSKIPSDVSAIITATMRIVTGFITIMTIDRCGRKVLVHISLIGVVTGNFFMGFFFVLKDQNYNVDSINWIPNIATVLLISMVYLGIFPVTLNLMGEIFPAPYKSAAAVVFLTHNWVLSFLVSKLFLVIGEEVGFGVVFFFFSFSCLLGEVWVCFFMIETKGKTFLEIQELLNN